ncbi:MAG TPA: HD domain-containing protein [Thermoanaerobaculia bacterium]|nr:HD domain-containing protein [Thermoanaerobaculia bacterium]
MPDHLPDRQRAWELLTEYTEKDGLRKHALAVEAAMREYARHYGEDEERWAITGLLHDFDYERWPDPEDHPYRGVEILERHGYPEDVRTAILGHAAYTGVPRETLMAKSLYAVDELAGFVVAVALVKPGRSLAEVDVRSVVKKLKDKAFARGVHREEVTAGAEELGVDFEEHVERVIAGLRRASDELGL